MSRSRQNDCVRIRVVNSLTDRSKNLRLSGIDLDDSMLEKICENPSTKEVLKWPSEQEEQIQKKTSQVQCVLKRESKEDRVFSEDDMGKMNIHDLVELQKEDSSGDLIQLILRCSISEEKKELNDDPNVDGKEQLSVIENDDVMAKSKIHLDHPLSPSILRRNPAPTKRRKRVSFSAASLDVPIIFDDVQHDLEGS
eukprot:scaffold1469_cov119-Cylindrotheca_fusiformis.AAC.37